MRVPTAAVAALAALLLVPVAAAYVPNDPLLSGTPGGCAWKVGCWPYWTTNLTSAWDTTTGSGDVTVAVVDSGVNAAHPDLAGSVLPGYNFLAGTTDASDDLGHGTSVAGIIAAHIGNGLGGVGVCGGCKILPVRVVDGTGSGGTPMMAQGIAWAADHGARVINVSLGATTADPRLEAAIRYAIGRGSLVVAAAGNSASTDPHACGTGTCGGYPAAFTSSIPSGLISVAAVDSGNQLFPYSNHGSWVLVAAPGSTMTPRWDGAYSAFGGTSAAAPFVSGIAALALSVQPSLTPAELQDAILSTVTRVRGLDVASGGIVDAAAVLRAVGAVPPVLAPAPPLAHLTAPAAVPVAAPAPVRSAGRSRVARRPRRGSAAGASVRRPS